jgi:uncharacterized membrane protein YkvA (DUF1232 family)
LIVSLYRRLSREIRTYRIALNDPRTPKAAKLLLRFAFAYLLSPLDLIPDAIPVLGTIDDLVVIPALLLAVRWLIPATVWADCRRQVVAQQAPQ